MFFVKSVKIGNIIKSAFHGDFRNIFICFSKKLTRMVDPHPCDIIAETDICHLTEIRRKIVGTHIYGNQASMLGKSKKFCPDIGAFLLERLRYQKRNINV